MPSEASTGFSTPPEDREGQRNRRLESGEPLRLSVYPESSRKLRFQYYTPKGGPSKPFPKQFNVTLARKRARELYDRLNESATDASERVLWKRLAVAGKKLYDEVIPPEVGDELQATARGTVLSLELSPKLAWIPWELLSYDEEKFLCTRFQIGRLPYKTPREIDAAKKRLDEKQIGGAFIAIGETNEPEKAVKEGEAVERIFKENGKLAWFYQSLGADSLLNALTKSYDVLHFTGHGVYDAKSREHTGWKCKDGKLLSRKAIDDISSKTAVPLLIFANACVSAHMSLSASEGFITSLYHGFFRKGVPHYVGTLTEVPQTPAEKFANAFYHELVRGATIGEALWRARLLFFDKPGAPIWAYYVHYGAPRGRVFAETPLAESEQKDTFMKEAISASWTGLSSGVQQEAAISPLRTESAGFTKKAKLSNNRLTCCAWDPKVHILYAAGFDGVLYLWNIFGNTHSAIPLGSSVIRAISTLKTYPYLILGDDNGRLLAVDMNIHQAGEIYSSVGPIYSIVHIPESNRMLIAERNGSVSELELRFHRLTTGVVHATARLLRVVHRHDGPVFAVRHDSARRRYVSVGADGMIRISEINTGKQTCRSITKGSLFALALATGPALLATGDSNGVIWILENGSAERTLIGHSDTVRSATFSTSHNWLLSGSKDKSVRLWHFNSLRVSIVLTASDYVYDVAFSPDGRWLSAIDGSGALWVVELAKPIDAFTADEVGALFDHSRL